MPDPTNDDSSDPTLIVASGGVTLQSPGARDGE